MATFPRMAECARPSPRFSALRRDAEGRFFKNANLRGWIGVAMLFQDQNGFIVFRNRSILLEPEIPALTCWGICPRSWFACVGGRGVIVDRQIIPALSA
jgi:hypothetical protein